LHHTKFKNVKKTMNYFFKIQKKEFQIFLKRIQKIEPSSIARAFFLALD